MSQVILHPGDNRVTLRRLIEDGVRVHSIVTDPPYGLVSVQKRFGKEGSKPARTEKNDGSFARLSGGFMGKQWDGTGIEREPEFWALIYDILLPGGYVFAFSGSRTGHWQAVAMELAGFIMHPMHGWVFGSGFPKAHAADMAIDVALGLRDPRAKDNEPYAPMSEQALHWEGWAYSTQAQKPALEPIYLGQKPFSEKTGAANLLKHGVGAVNIDGCRVPSADNTLRQRTANDFGLINDDGWQPKPGQNGSSEGRHPANLMHDGSDEVVAMFPAQAGAAAQASGPTQSGKSKSGSMSGHFNGMGDRPARFHSDSGSAARFFHAFPPDTNPIFYHSKAAKADRAGSKHPTVKPIALMQYLIRHITPPGGIVLDPFAGSGTTAEAARREGFDCILMEAEEEYIDFLRQRFDLPGAKVNAFEDLLGLDAPANSTDCGIRYEELI